MNSSVKYVTFADMRQMHHLYKKSYITLRDFDCIILLCHDVCKN